MSQSFRFGVLVVLLVTACGGKTDSGGNEGSGTPSGGSGPGSGGGTGAVAGGGTGAFGGGGTGAFGGGGTGAFGGGGTGAFGGGGTGAVGGWDSKIDAACGAISKLPCPMPDCYGQLSQAVKNAISAGCEAQVAAVLDCALQYPLYCMNGEPQLPVECQKLADQLDQCGVASCDSWGASDGSCGVDCKSWGADCKPDPSGSLFCFCTLGPATGKQFQLPGSCGSSAWQSQVAQFCG